MTGEATLQDIGGGWLATRFTGRHAPGSGPYGRPSELAERSGTMAREPGGCRGEEPE